MEDDQDQPPPQRPDSLLPYDEWTEEALRYVVVRALAYVAANGMPGDHHFYVSFRTDRPGVTVPTRLLAQYPQEMTIVLQHQFWDLRIDDGEGGFGIGLSFGGVPSKLSIPFSAVTAFADPHVQFGLRFRTSGEVPANDMAQEAAPADEPDAGLTPEPAADPSADASPGAPAEAPQVVSLDAFRRRTPTKD